MRVVLSLIMLLVSFASIQSAHGACMSEIDASAYGCVSAGDAQANEICEKKHGKRFKAFVTDNVCTEQLAAELRGESLDPASIQTPEVVEAACMSYEQGTKNGCDYYDYEPAQLFCARNFGNRYIGFIPNNSNCSLENAATLRGEVSGDVLVDGLASRIDEIETIMTMIDREGLGNSLGGYEYNKPKIGNEFYTDVVQALMAKMNTFKKIMLENGAFNVGIKDPKTVDYLKYAFRYLGVLGRLYKVYAYVAHENHMVLKTYSFKNLEYLNLVLKKEHALEILAQVNYRAKTVNNGKNIEFIVGQQERQTFEYLAMQAPATKKDYAKLVSFMGVRENLTNLWGVQRMSAEEIHNDRTKSCGNFLSFRPGAQSSMTKSLAYSELLEYDVFYNDYVPRWEALVEASLDVAVLNAETATELGVDVLGKVSELKELLANGLGQDFDSQEDLRRQAAKDATMLVEAENAYWKQFSYDHFSSVVLPGDGVLNENAILERIAQEAYNKRMDAIVEVYLSSYLWVSDSALNKIEKTIREFGEKNLRSVFENRLKTKVAQGLGDYNSKSELAKKNREKKENETFEAAQKAVVAVSVLDAIKNHSLNFATMKTLQPSSIEELMMLFQDRVEREFFDLKQTLTHNEKLAKFLSAFFKEITKEFNQKYVSVENGQQVLSGSIEERSHDLREIAFEIARKWFSVYPYTIASNKTKALPVSVYDLDKNAIPVFADGTPAAMSNVEFLRLLPKKEVSAPSYVLANANTRVYFGETEPVKTTEGRNNPDRMTVGKIGRPLEVVSPGVIRTSRGEAEIDNDKLSALFKSFGVLSDRLKGLKKEGTKEEAQQTIGKFLVIKEPAKFLFRALEALNLSDVGMRSSVVGGFADDAQAQALLGNNLVSQAYQVAPILRNELPAKKTVVKYCFTKTDRPYRCDYEKDVNIALLEKIAIDAYDRASGSFDEAKARALVSATIDNAIENTPNKLSTFCGANYLNYVNDVEFKDAYKASGFLRSTLKSGVGQSSATLERIKKFDETITKEIRGKWEAWNEDYFEPALHILGTAAIVALGVVLVIGTGGAAAPGVLGGLYAAASTLMAIEFFISFPLVVGSLYARLNTHFIEVPAQLKFQESIALSQVDFSKVVDWDMLDEEKEANSTSKAWTLGLMPLDFFYGAMLVRHVQKETGMIGRAAFARLTGTELRGWSAPARVMTNNPRFSELRETLGFKKALSAKVTQQVNKVKAFMPKYQAIPENMIRSTSLRMGIVRKAQSVGIGNKPWVLLEEINAHSNLLKNRLRQFEVYAESEAKVVTQIRLKGRMKGGEILANFKNTAVYFVPATLARRIKSLDWKGMGRFFTNFGEVWAQLKTVQGSIINSRASNIDAVANKLADFQKGVKAGHYKGDNMMQQFIENLTDAEILVLEEVAKKSQGAFSHFKKVFKDYQQVVYGLKPASYLAGYPGQAFQAPAYSTSHLLDGQTPAKQVFKSDAQDLINFYESMIRNSAAKTETMNELREKAEEALARKIKNENGNASEF